MPTNVVAPTDAASGAQEAIAPRALLSWSGGKDSALALHRVREHASVRVDALLTTVTDGHDRVSMHGVRRALLDAQAAAIGLPLTTVRIPPVCTNDEYESRTGEALADYAARAGQAVVFGDLFLADVRAYRERLLAPHGLAARFPLWGEDTTALARRFVALGFRATLVCVDPRQLDASFVGCPYDDALLDALPPGVDPCGERGEFHTFVHDGPIFRRPVPVRTGEIVERGGFAFADLLPG
ncbi:MAG: Dph6-related ATP pyrophosphatase [Gemmatirosa sp.]